MRKCTRCTENYLEYGQRARKKTNQQEVINYLKKNPCVECGESRIACLQFDHIHTDSKRFTISTMLVRVHSLVNIMEEISKCRVLCANCHFVRTAKQFTWYKGLDL